jgi:glycerophosphoryl diester phosphodiesterase
MFKKFVCILLCLIPFFAVFVCAEQAEEPGEIYFYAGFDDDELPRDTDVTFGEDGYIYAEDKVLKFEASLTYPPVSTVLFPYKTQHAEYVYECDVKLSDALSGSCWLSLCFGAYNEDILYEFTLKCGAEEPDSVSIRYKSGASSWKTVCSASLSDFIGEGGIDASKFSGGMIKAGASFHLAVAVKSGTAFGYVDGVAVAEGRITGGGDGFVGFNGRGVTFDADNISVNSKLPSGVSAADTFKSVLYTPETGIIEPPLIIQRNKASLPIYSTNDVRPGAVMTTVRETDGVLHCFDGAVDLGDISVTVQKLASAVLPAFYVSDAQTASSLSAYLRNNSINDAYVIVSRTSILSEFRENKYIRFAVDLTSRDAVSVSDVYDMLYSNGVRTVVLSEAAADADTVFELHKRLISVWVSVTQGTLSLFRAAASGADAIITSEAPELLAKLFEFSEPTLLRRPVVISRGGDSAAAPADTLKSVISAFDNGVSVALIDVFLTRDNVPVLSQNDVVTGMSAEAVISGSLVSSLKALTYTDGRMDGTDRITTLEELFEAVCRNYPDTVLHIKVDDVAAENAVILLANEYGMRQRTVIVSDNTAVLNHAKSNSFAAAYGAGPYVWDGRDDAISISSICRHLTEYNSVYYSQREEMPAELLSLIHGRGMAAFVTDSADNGIPVLEGYDGFTLSSSARASKLAASLFAVCDTDGRLNAKVIYSDGTELDVTALCSIIPLRGFSKLTGGVVSGGGDFAVICPQSTDDGTKYYVCSLPLTVSERPAGDDTEKLPQDETGNNTANIIIIASASVAAAAGIITLAVLAHKKHKNAQNNA